MTKVLGFFFDGVLGRLAAVGLAFGVLIGWWQLDRYQQRQAGAAAEQLRQERAAHAQVEQAESVRADAERSARGERVRAVQRDLTTEPPRVVDTSLRSFRPISTRPGDTCETQREAAAHNSVYDTKRFGSRKVYCSRCDCPELYPDAQPATKPAAPGEPQPKVS